jgi:hypothetical protein
MTQSANPNPIDPTDPIETPDLPNIPEAEPVELEIEQPQLEEWNDVAAVRDVILAAYPDCVPELVQGSTVKELLDSVQLAREAFFHVAKRLADRQRAQAVEVSRPPVVPAGGAGLVIDPDLLPPTEKLRRAIAAQSS